jgi:hypothetical protein
MAESEALAGERTRRRAGPSSLSAPGPFPCPTPAFLRPSTPPTLTPMGSHSHPPPRPLQGYSSVDNVDYVPEVVALMEARLGEQVHMGLGREELASFLRFSDFSDSGWSRQGPCVKARERPEKARELA